MATEFRFLIQHPQARQKNFGLRNRVARAQNNKHNPTIDRTAHPHSVPVCSAASIEHRAWPIADIYSQKNKLHTDQHIAQNSHLAFSVP